MADESSEGRAGPDQPDRAASEAERRRARQAEALRENLRRRKARERASSPSGDEQRDG
jgi:hypothetical protein